jgi:hypothetical protein
MGQGSESKYVEFVIEDSEEIEEIMGSDGFLVGRGWVAISWSDDDIFDEVEHSLCLEWISDNGEKEILVGAKHDAVFDEIFERIRVRDLLLIDEGCEVNLSQYSTASIAEMISAHEVETVEINLLEEDLEEMMETLHSAEVYSHITKLKSGKMIAIDITFLGE